MYYILKIVKQTLDQIRVSMPEMKKFKDQLTYKKYDKNKAKYSVYNNKNFEKLNVEDILNLNDYDDKLELLEETYNNFCSAITKINSTTLKIENDLCKAPKILSDLIIFKKNLKQAFKKTIETGSPEKRFVRTIL
jgi:hypothetical protein